MSKCLITFIRSFKTFGSQEQQGLQLHTNVSISPTLNVSRQRSPTIKVCFVCTRTVLQGHPTVYVHLLVMCCLGLKGSWNFGFGRDDKSTVNVRNAAQQRDNKRTSEATNSKDKMLSTCSDCKPGVQNQCKGPESYLLQIRSAQSSFPVLGHSDVCVGNHLWARNEDGTVASEGGCFFLTVLMIQKDFIRKDDLVLTCVDC